MSSYSRLEKRLVLLRLVLGLAASVLLARAAPADPRWWRLQAGYGEAYHPDIAVIVQPGNPQPGFVIVEEIPENTPTPHLTIGLTTMSGDDCSSTGGGQNGTWVDDLVDNTAPRVEAAVTSQGMAVIRIVFERLGQIGAAMCDSLTFPGFNNTGGLGQPVQIISRPGPGVDSRPRIGSAWSGSTYQSHAVWTRTLPGGGTTIEYAHDLGGVGIWTPAVDLSAIIGATGTEPDVAADGVASADTPVSVAFVDSVTGEVRLTRSGDGGATWSAPMTVSGAGGTASPAIAAGTGLLDARVWNALLWQAAPAPAEMRFDAALWTSPLARNPDFDPAAGDQAASLPPPTPGAGPALAVAPAAVDPSAFFLAWTDASMPGHVALRSGVLDAIDATNPRHLDRYPFPPVRVYPPDPVDSSIVPLLCAWDEASGGCAPPYSAWQGTALNVSIAAAGPSRGLPATFAVAYEADAGIFGHMIFVLSTNGILDVIPGINGVSTSCQALRRAQADVEWYPGCDEPTTVGGLRRWLLYDGCEPPCPDLPNATATGPWASRTVFKVPTAGPGPFVSPVKGLRGDATYDMALIPEDDARNLAPPTFDPRTAANDPAGFGANQRTVVTTPPCEPQIQASCSLVTDLCGGVSDGVYAPGDLARYQVTFTNSGDWQATAVRAHVLATDATPVAPPLGDLDAGDVAAGATSAPVIFDVALKSACPFAPTVKLTLVRSDEADPEGPVTYADVACPAPAPLACAPICTACVTGALPRAGSLLAVKSGASLTDVDLTWTIAGGNAAEEHLNAVAIASDVPAPSSQRATVGVGEPRCTVVGGSGGCTDVGLVADPRPLLFLQAYAACGADGSDEGPP